MSKPIARYRIKDWEDAFESAESRKIKVLGRMLTPIKFDGMAYGRLMAREDGPAIYGVFIAIAGVAARCPERGVLEDENGAFDLTDLQIKTRIPAAAIKQAIDVLTDPEVRINWIEVENIEESSQSDRHPDAPGDEPDEPGEESDAIQIDATTREGEVEVEVNRTELKGKGSKPNTSASDQKARSNTSASDSSRTDRAKANVRFRMEASRLWAPKGAHCSDGKGDQRLSDDTSTTRLFDDHIWPDGLSPPEGRSRVDAALKLIPDAAKRKRPMAWLTKAVKAAMNEI